MEPRRSIPPRHDGAGAVRDAAGPVPAPRQSRGVRLTEFGSPGNERVDLVVPAAFTRAHGADPAERGRADHVRKGATMRAEDTAHDTARVSSS